MIPIIGVVLMLAVIGVLLYAKFHNSKVVDKLTHDLTTENTHDFKETPDLIKDAQQADKALVQRVEDNSEVIEKVKKDTASIRNHKKEDEAPKGGE